MAAPVIIFQGFAAKPGVFHKAFKRRYWRLYADGKLKYFPDEIATEPKGIINLIIDELEYVCGDELERLSFQGPFRCRWLKKAASWSQRMAIATPGRTYFLAFDTAADCQRLRAAIQAMIEAMQLEGVLDIIPRNPLTKSMKRHAVFATAAAASPADVHAQFLNADFHEVLVIGAGVAGLAAAWTLRNAYECQDVLVLEKNPCAGGRVRKITLPSLPDQHFDAGAAWIHGTSGNPVAEIAKAMGMRTVTSTEGLQSSTLSLGVVAQGKAVPASEVQAAHQRHKDVMEEVEEAIDDMMAAFEDRDKPLPADTTMAEAYERELVKSDDYDQVDTLHKQLLGYLRSRDEEFNAAGFDKLSFNYFLEDEDFPGPQLVTENMCQLVDHFQETVDVQCDTTIVSIELLETEQTEESEESTTDPSLGRVRVTCADGRVLHANQVIMATPITTLQRQQISFSPPLPEQKQTAIDQIGFGTLNKIFFHFKRAFWDDPSLPEDVRGKEYIACLDDFVDPVGNSSEIQAMPLHFLNYNAWFEQPVLAAVLYGQLAEALEEKSDVELQEMVVAVLRRMYPSVPEEDLVPLSCAATRWKQDDTGGSFSVMQLNATGPDMDEYARPLQAKDGTAWLYFAGEATCKDHYATVHGAFLSGRRAAKEADASMQGVGLNYTNRISLSIHTLEERAQLVAKAAIQLRRLKAKAQETLEAGQEADPNKPRAGYEHIEADELASVPGVTSPPSATSPAAKTEAAQMHDEAGKLESTVGQIVETEMPSDESDCEEEEDMMQG
eukprot:m.243328 g.243328  ORF g.243328 m.243328 type:complete len:780 (-) comp17462_c0_seq2:1769-4108(-)